MAPDRILIVDDDPDTLLLLDGALEGSGFETATATSAAAALALLSSEPFDLVLTDKNLAGEDGLALLQEVWRRHPAMVAAIISGYRSEEVPSLGADARLLAYFEKPIYDLRVVAETLKEALANHRARAQT